ncbi:FK506-binding protein-like, partial [Rhea pennata]|uniref:FK506-binding protein-like n=1 Tax=Rhea pennata TaxID=8795 RepID=UPI002E26F139
HFQPPGTIQGGDGSPRAVPGAGGRRRPAGAALGPWDLANEAAWLREPCEEPEDDVGAEEEDEEEGDDAEDGRDEAGGWWRSPDGAFSKQVLRRGRGLARPGPGSRCRVLLEAPAATAPAAAAGRWVALRLGTAEGAWAAAVDACLETMAAGERARLRPAAAAAAVGLRLAAFAPAPEPWEQPPGELWAAGWPARPAPGGSSAPGRWRRRPRQYGAALRLAVAGAGRPPLAPERAGLKADLHANLALCQLRLGLPAPAADNCAKALALRPGHLKARYRRGLAAAALGDLEAAADDLAAVARARPGDGDARRELQRVGRRARERDARLAQTPPAPLRLRR